MKFVLLILYLLCASSLFAQLKSVHSWWEPAGPSFVQMLDPLNVPTMDNRIALGFEHTLALYNWANKVNFRFGKELYEPTVFVVADGLSRLRQETGSRTSELIGIIQPTIPLVEGTTLVQATIYASVYNNDTRSSNAINSLAHLSNVTDGYILAGGKQILDTNLTLQVNGGIAIRNNSVSRSSGPMLLSQLTLTQLPIDENNTLESFLKVDERRFSYADEVYRNDNFSFTLRSNFGESGSNVLSSGASLKRRDFYSSLDSNTLIKQERDEFAVDVINKVNYPIIRERLLSRLELQIAPSTIRRRTPGFDISLQSATGSVFLSSLTPSNTSRSDFGVLAALDLLPSAAQTASMSSSVILSYHERSEENTIETSELANNSSQVISNISELLKASSFASQETSILINAALPLSSMGSIFGEFGARIYRYDTPSDENLDDRDEQYTHTAIRYEHQFSTTFTGSAGLRLSKNHLVYLEGERSAQNNSIHSITLLTKTSYNSEHIVNVLSGEVFANYTQYDFFLLSLSLTGTRDYIIRGMSIRDSLFIPYALSTTLKSGIELRFDIRLSEQGTFNTDAFTTRPQLAAQEVVGESLVHLVTGTQNYPVLIRGGVKTLILSRSIITPSASISSLSTQEQSFRYGPVLYLTLDQSHKSGMRFYGYCWYGFVNSHRMDGGRLNDTQVEGRIVAEVKF